MTVIIGGNTSPYLSTNVWGPVAYAIIPFGIMTPFKTKGQTTFVQGQIYKFVLPYYTDFPDPVQSIQLYSNDIFQQFLQLSYLYNVQTATYVDNSGLLSSTTISIYDSLRGIEIPYVYSGNPVGIDYPSIGQYFPQSRLNYEVDITFTQCGSYLNSVLYITIFGTQGQLTTLAPFIQAPPYASISIPVQVNSIGEITAVLLDSYAPSSSGLCVNILEVKVIDLDDTVYLSDIAGSLTLSDAGFGSQNGSPDTYFDTDLLSQEESPVQLLIPVAPAASVGEPQIVYVYAIVPSGSYPTYTQTNYPYNTACSFFGGATASDYIVNLANENGGTYCTPGITLDNGGSSCNVVTSATNSCGGYSSTGLTYVESDNTDYPWGCAAVFCVGTSPDTPNNYFAITSDPPIPITLSYSVSSPTPGNPGTWNDLEPVPSSAPGTAQNLTLNTPLSCANGQSAHTVYQGWFGAWASNGVKAYTIFNLYTCSLYCTETPNCLGWSFSSAQNLCWLYDTSYGSLGDPVAQSGWASGCGGKTIW